MRQIGPPELLLLLFVLVLLIRAKKLPELARGTGQALRIFKMETTAADAIDAGAVHATAANTNDDES